LAQTPLHCQIGQQLATIVLDEKTWLMTAVIALPALITLVGTWGGEFPFSGDHDHHAAAAVLGAKY
jgi:hypothetical protein